MDAKSGDGRLIGTIPVPINDVGLDSVDIDITYEPYTLLYRPVNNPVPFTLNNLEIEVYYNDFIDNKRRYINNINGTMNLELNFRQGTNPPKIINDLRSY